MLSGGRRLKGISLGRAGSRTLARVGVVALLVFALLARSAWAETRIALVIGNAAYAEGPLANPRNDAELMARTLRGVGFEVTTVLDGGQEAMKRAIVDFGRRLTASDAVGLFYYAGHGVQVDGENFLIPVGVEIVAVEEVALYAISLTDLLKTMGRAQSRLNIAILDACRDNPFPAASRSLARGLAPVTAPSGTLIAYATAPGEVALDGAGANSPYTAALAAQIPHEGSPLEDVFRRTRRKVLDVTGGRQTPWEHSSLTGEFFFRPKSATSEASARQETARAEEARLAELAAWEKIKSTSDPKLLRRHIDAFPDGLFAELAALKLANLERPPSPWSWLLTGSTGAPPERTEAEALYEEALKHDGDKAAPDALAKAARLYRKAADLGLPAAMYRLARAYDKGRGVARDLAEAAGWYRRAADLNHAGAMASLGIMHEFGEGVPRDLAEALRLYGLAAERGDPNGMTSLAYLYAEGKGVARNAELARKWYTAAAERAAPRAMFNLALMYARGEGGRVDLAETVRWLKTAADAQHGPALRELACLYDEGRGVARDPKRAAEYLLAAYKAGERQARDDVLTRSHTWSYATRREVQRALAVRGLYDGPATGLFDGTTRRALEQLALEE
jgi:TPR repeat protein